MSISVKQYCKFLSFDPHLQSVGEIGVHPVLHLSLPELRQDKSDRVLFPPTEHRVERGIGQRHYGPGEGHRPVHALQHGVVEHLGRCQHYQLLSQQFQPRGQSSITSTCQITSKFLLLYKCGILFS